jgi:hypothetical protein
MANNNTSANKLIDFNGLKIYNLKMQTYLASNYYNKTDVDQNFLRKENTKDYLTNLNFLDIDAANARYGLYEHRIIFSDAVSNLTFLKIISTRRDAYRNFSSLEADFNGATVQRDLTPMRILAMQYYSCNGAIVNRGRVIGLATMPQGYNAQINLSLITSGTTITCKPIQTITLEWLSGITDIVQQL